MAVETALSVLRPGDRAALPSAIVISGPQAFLRVYVFDTVRRRMLRQGMKYRGFQVGGAEGFDAVLAELREADLFAPVRLVGCRVLRSHRGGGESSDDDDGVPSGNSRALGIQARTLEVFDTQTNTWTQAKPMSLPRNHHSVAYADGKIYAIGGRVGSCFSNGWSSNVSMNEAYDVATDTWLTRLPMPTARSGTGAEALEGRIHVLGGEGWVEEFGGVFRAHEVYDPKTNTWAKVARMPTPRHGFATAAIGRRIYAVSGVNNAGGAGTLSVVPANEIYEE
jgi:hypothetical protein